MHRSAPPCWVRCCRIWGPPAGGADRRGSPQPGGLLRTGRHHGAAGAAADQPGPVVALRRRGAPRANGLAQLPGGGACRRRTAAHPHGGTTPPRRAPGPSRIPAPPCCCRSGSRWRSPWAAPEGGAERARSGRGDGVAAAARPPGRRHDSLACPAALVASPPGPAGGRPGPAPSGGGLWRLVRASRLPGPAGSSGPLLPGRGAPRRGPRKPLPPASAPPTAAAAAPPPNCAADPPAAAPAAPALRGPGRLEREASRRPAPARGGPGRDGGCAAAAPARRARGAPRPAGPAAAAPRRAGARARSGPWLDPEHYRPPATGTLGRPRTSGALRPGRAGGRGAPSIPCSMPPSIGRPAGNGASR